MEEDEFRYTAYARRRLTLGIILAAIILLVIIFSAIRHSRGGQHPTPKAYIGQRILCSGGTLPYIPPARAFGDHACRYIVASAFSWEADLTPGQTPDQDSDYLHGYGVQVKVRLPGGKRDYWTFGGSVNVIGSGCVSEWIAPNGGRIALLHLTCGIGWTSSRYTGAPIPLPTIVTGVRPKRWDNDDIDHLTALAVGSRLERAPGPPSLGRVRGGTQIGLSQWPTDPIFGNGLAGPANSHTCFISTPLATDWIYRYMHGMIHHSPPPFPKKKWGTRRYKDRHGHLLWQARVWLHDKERLGHYRSQRWFERKGVMRYDFQRGAVYRWVHHPKWKPKIVRKGRTRQHPQNTGASSAGSGFRSASV